MRLASIVAALLVLAVSTAPARAQTSAATSHDFDFGLGEWTTHIQRLARPLTGSHAWTSYSGTVTARGVWNGRGSVEEIEIDGPAGHLELLGVRLYDAQSKQWHLTNVNAAAPSLSDPATGSFAGGRGAFYDQEAYDGRMILVRQTFFDITPRSYAYEQAFSGDGGRTWEPNFVAHLVRLAATAPSEGARSVSDTSHDFDFNCGTWHTRIRSLPESGETSRWTALQGTVKIRKIWNGRAFLEEIKAANARGGFEGLTLYLYDPRAHQWSQTFASSDGGTFDPSMFGTFADGRGELVSQAPYAGTMVFMRDVWSHITSNSHHFEIQLSRDGARTWNPIFEADLTRASV